MSSRADPGVDCKLEDNAPAIPVNVIAALLIDAFNLLWQQDQLLAVNDRNPPARGYAFEVFLTELVLAALPRLGLGDIAPPDGAFYIYASVAGMTDDSLALCHRMLLETGVAAAPDIDFDPVDGHRYLRFSFALATPELEDAIERLARWLPQQRG